MGDTGFKNAVDFVSKVIDGAGVLAIVAGVLIAAVAFALAQRHHERREKVLSRLPPAGRSSNPARPRVPGRSRIIRTVAVAPSVEGVGVLAIVVAVRTFLSFTSDVELDGRWPWQQAPWSENA